MKWIDVKENFPPENVYILVVQYDYRPKVKMKFIVIAERIGNHFYDDKGEITNNGKYGIVTHWMPLPDLPKE